MANLPSLTLALRGLRDRPGFSLLAILSLALGLGVNIAIFSALESVVLNPLPFPQADRLVAVYEDSTWVGYPKNTPAPANFFDWQRQSTSFESMAATSSCRAVLTGDGAPEEVRCRSLTANTWAMLGVRPLVGRWFTETEDHPIPNVALIGEGLWERRYGRDASIVNRTVLINGRAVRIAGVMPVWFRFGGDMELWVPAGFTDQDKAKRSSHYLTCFGRLKSGVSAAQAEAELRAIQTRLNQLYPKESDPRQGVTVESLRDALVGKTRTVLAVLLGAAGLVLIIACFNVANLLIAKAAARQRELAVRSALGASAANLLTQVFLETLTLTALGGLGGVALALVSRRLLENFIPPAMKGVVAIQLDLRVFAFAALVSLAAAALASMTPILFIRRAPLMHLLRQDARTGSGRGTVRLRSLLVAGQVALTVALLASAGLMTRSLMAIWGTDVGFNPSRMMAVRVNTTSPKYQDDHQRWQFYRETLENIRAMPGVASADYATTPPFFSIGNSNGFRVEGISTPGGPEHSDILSRIATAGYLQTIGAKLIEGRYFTSADREGTLPVVIVNETFARLFFPNGSAVGKRLATSADGPTLMTAPVWRTIIGVVGDVRERGYDYAPKPVSYMTVDQMKDWNANFLIVRAAAGSPEDLAGGIKQAVQKVDPDQPVGAARTFDDVLAQDQASRRQQMFLLAAFAALSLTMACLGIYAILAFSVELRKQEIGVRMALGANRANVVRLILADGMKLTALGGAMGVLLAIASARILESSLYGVKSFDPLSLAAVCGLLAFVALAACFGPALRASATHPSIALRS